MSELMERDGEKLLRSSDEPDVAALTRLYERSAPVADRFHRIEDADNIRLNRWDNKDEDGKKHSTEEEEAFPFEGASDSENFLADDAINEMVALLVVGFWRSVVQRIHGVEASDLEQASDFNRLLEWMMNTKLHKELVREVELSAQYMLTYGYVLLKVIWDRRLGRRLAPVTMEEIAALALQVPGLAQFPDMIQDPEREDEAVDLMTGQLDAFVRALFSQYFGKYEEELCEHYKLSTRRVRRVVRELREDGESRIPQPYFVRNQPAITALRIGDDAFLPDFLSTVQEGTIFTREFMTEAILRSRGALEGWDPEWVEEAAKLKGRQSNWAVDRTSELTDDAWEFQWQGPETTNHELIEVTTAWQWCLDEDDVAERYYTIFHAALTESGGAAQRNLYARHDRLDYDHGLAPFVLGMREWRSRNVNSSRGLPMILRSRQRQLKTFYDGLIDLQSIAVHPPLNVYDTGLGTKWIFGPAQQNPVAPGREPKFAEIPTNGSPMAFELVQTVRADVDNAIGLMSPTVAPPRVQTKQQMVMNGFLMMWTEALQQAFALITQYTPAEEFERITGSKTPMPKGQDIAHARDFILSLDVRTMDMEHVLKEFKAIADTVRPMDQDGVIDTAKLVKAMVRAINPSLAREIILDKSSASQAVHRKVQNDVMLMLGGFEPEYGVDDDPAASVKMQSIQQILQTNPRVAQALGNPQAGQAPADPAFAEKFQKYMENIQFNIEQQANKGRGRTGV